MPGRAEQAKSVPVEMRPVETRPVETGPAL